MELLLRLPLEETVSIQRRELRDLLGGGELGLVLETGLAGTGPPHSPGRGNGVSVHGLGPPRPALHVRAAHAVEQIHQSLSGK